MSCSPSWRRARMSRVWFAGSRLSRRRRPRRQRRTIHLPDALPSQVPASALQRQCLHRHRGRSSGRRPHSATACSSRSARKPMTGFGASRLFFEGRSPMATLERSSIAQRSCFCGRSRRRSSGWLRSRVRAGLSVPGRIAPPPNLRAILRKRSSAPSGRAMVAGAPTSRPAAGDAPRRRFWSSTTSRRTRTKGHPRSTTSRCAVGGTTSTKRSCCSDPGGARVRRRRVQVHDRAFER